MNTSTASASAAPSARYWKGVAACLVATILIGVMFPVMTDALRRIDPFTFTSLRYLIAGVALALLLLYREGPVAFRADGESLPIAWLLGSVGFCGFGSFVFLGQQLSGEQGALNASIMMATQPMMGLLVNALVRRSAPPLPSLVCVVISFTGVALVITRGDLRAALLEPQHYAASGLIVLGALCWVIYTFGSAYFTRWSALKYTTITTWLGLSTIVGVNVLLVVTRVVSAPTFAALRAVTPHLIYMGPIAGFVAILCWISGNRTLGPMNGVLFMDVVPVTTFVVSALAGVVPNKAQVLGAALTASALVLNNLYLRQRAQITK
ncbi:DMT family transporter [Paraburkholderia sp. Ac-20336]|uniref:DMT family transporter n=1 Tax=Burkholderiaceae TaxID=119060 RepID=UPI00142200D7|nr:MULTISPECIES: DMT family transporter [Burkholderiaceae]MBN3802203.1 DMT family transporter [Paraburkholderia sp. Ac-20336]MBN3848547.1 DMT family transporter [Paraburkholderia sp. Ac-20342]NIF54886.1 DMT family transporter [Burkholderia sp. Ax-1724]